MTQIDFFCTGIEALTGGIQSANRNIRDALLSLSSDFDLPLRIHILHEAKGRSEKVVSYGGRRTLMALAISRSIISGHLSVFDHVGLAKPLAFLKVLGLARGRSVIFAHGSESWKKLTSTNRRVFQAADLVLTNSNFTLQNMRRTFDGFTGQVCMLGLPPHFVLTPSPPQPVATRPVLRASDGTERAISDRTMLLVGRMDPAEREKGHRELISLWPRVCREVADADLVFVGGGGDAQALAQIAASSPAAGRIFLAGRVDDHRLSELYAAAYAYVMPSRQEGFGLVYLEAMNHALPCLACHEDGAADVVVDRETGLLVKQPIDDEELTAALVDLLSNPSHARKLGEAGWRRLNNHFTAEAHRSRVEAALMNLLK